MSDRTKIPYCHIGCRKEAGFGKSVAEPASSWKIILKALKEIRECADQPTIDKVKLLLKMDHIVWIAAQAINQIERSVQSTKTKLDDTT